MFLAVNLSHSKTLEFQVSAGFSSCQMEEMFPSLSDRGLRLIVKFCHNRGSEAYGKLSFPIGERERFATALCVASLTIS